MKNNRPLMKCVKYFLIGCNVKMSCCVLIAFEATKRFFCLITMEVKYIDNDIKVVWFPIKCFMSLFQKLILKLSNCMPVLIIKVIRWYNALEVLKLINILINSSFFILLFSLHNSICKLGQRFKNIDLIFSLRYHN